MSYSYIQQKKWQRSGRPRYYVKPPVEIDKEYESEIEEMGRFGDGIARIKGFIIIVPNTGLGKQVKFRITRIGKKFAFGESVLD